MATSRNIQYLGSDGSGVINDVDLSSRRQVETFFVTGAAGVNAGDWVTFASGTTGVTNSLRAIYVERAPTSQTSSAVVGVTLASASVGSTVQVVVRGYVEGANVASAVTSGQSLVCDGASAGRAAAYLAASLVPPCGVALESASSNTCDVYVLGQF
jgi:hypothetical protein